MLTQSDLYTIRKFSNQYIEKKSKILQIKTLIMEGWFSNHRGNIENTLDENSNPGGKVF